MMARKRCDKRTTELRIEAVYRMILDGWTSAQILQNVTRQWDIKIRMAHTYLARALQRVREEAQQDHEQLLAEHLAARRQLRREAKQAKDLRLAADILRDEAKLLGLYPAERREIDLPDGGLPVRVIEIVEPTAEETTDDAASL